ncbi:hypothetical protein [Bremerella cremea]|uniref:hypothetical protein n=1 Tax=Bremerella cremea TaxID=1031537 RepID=UPI0031EED25E
MPELTQDDAIQQFLTMAQAWHSDQATCHRIIEAFVAFYEDIQIVGADREKYDDADMFSIETGPTKEIGIPEIADFRGVGDECLNDTSAQNYQAIMIYRTVHAIDELSDMSEFDDDAFNMNARLYFDPTDDTSFSGWQGFVEIGNPTKVILQLPALLSDPKIARLLDKVPAKAEFFVGGAG